MATFPGNMTDPAHEHWTNCGFRDNAKMITRDSKTTPTIKNIVSGSFVAQVSNKNFGFKDVTYEAPTLVKIRLHAC